MEIKERETIKELRDVRMKENKVEEKVERERERERREREPKKKRLL